MTPTDLLAFLESRRSIRRFKPDPVPAPVVEGLVVAAAHAPSAHNLQPWRFVNLLDSEARKLLGAALTEKMRHDMEARGADRSDIASRVERSLRRIREAPVSLLLCRDATAVRGSEPEETSMAVQSVAAAGLQLLLAAHARGLAGNWICWPLYAQGEVQKALNLSKTWEPQAMFFLGYADEQPAAKQLKPISEILITL